VASPALGVSRQLLHKILAEKFLITSEMVVWLGKFCGDEPDIWMRMQAAHHVAKARLAMADIVKHIPIARPAVCR
jgi:addiction module HigA family antidote